MRRTLGLLLLLLVPCELHGTSEVRTVLVFPFENQSPRSDLNWIAESFAIILSSRLAGPENYVLGREERNGAYLQLGMPPETSLTLASEYKVAQTLGVDWAVVGSFNVEGDRLSARGQLLEMRRSKLSPAMEVSGALADLVDLQSRLAWRFLATYDPSFTAGKEEDFLRRFPDVRLAAFENYIRGLLATDDESRLHFLLESDRLNPMDHGAAFALGRFYFEQKDFANSVKWLQKVRPPDSYYLESVFLGGVDEFVLGHQQAAEKAFEALSQQVPLNEVFNNLGALKARRGKYEEALADFNRAYQADSSDPDFCFNRGVSLWYLNRYSEAAKSLEEAIRLNDDDSEAHTLLAVVLEKLGDSAGEQHQLGWLAEHEVGSAADLPGDILPQPRLKRNYDGRAFRLLSLTLQNELEKRLANVSVEQHSEVHLARGQKFLAEGRLPEAERELEEAVQLVPANSETRVALAQVLEAEGKHREAAGELETSLKLKNSVAAHVTLARVYLSLGQPDLARDQSRAALELDPGNQDAERLIKQSGTSTARKKP